jgi:hypothetical protein
MGDGLGQGGVPRSCSALSMYVIVQLGTAIDKHENAGLRENPGVVPLVSAVGARFQTAKYPCSAKKTEENSGVNQRELG